MNVKHIFVFTIYVVLPNGLYSINQTTFDPKQFCIHLAETWIGMIEKFSPFKSDKEGNIIIKVLVKPDDQKNEFFVPNMYRIGVYIVAIDEDDKINKELIKYLAEVFEIPTHAVKIVEGEKLLEKTVQMSVGYGLIKEGVINTVCKQLSEP